MSFQQSNDAIVLRALERSCLPAIECGSGSPIGHSQMTRTVNSSVTSKDKYRTNARTDESNGQTQGAKGVEEVELNSHPSRNNDASSQYGIW
jgi:hypothetical protein